jgi:hypothetical protein
MLCWGVFYHATLELEVGRFGSEAASVSFLQVYSKEI